MIMYDIVVLVWHPGCYAEPGGQGPTYAEVGREHRDRETQQREHEAWRMGGFRSSRVREELGPRVCECNSSAECHTDR